MAHLVLPLIIIGRFQNMEEEYHVYKKNGRP